MVRAATGDERRVRLSKERVLSAAVALADRDGVESLTMRKLADELGAGAMSLYHHVPNKERLLDGMVDAVFGEIELPSTDVDWRTAMRRRAVSTREVPRPAIPGRSGSGVAAEPRAGELPPAQRRCSAPSARVASPSRWPSTPTRCRTPTSTGSRSREEPAVRGREESAEVAETMMAEMLRQVPADEYPYLVEVVGGFVATSGYDFAEEFLFGLDLILDGLDRLRTRRTPHERSGPTIGSLRPCSSPPGIVDGCSRRLLRRPARARPARAASPSRSALVPEPPGRLARRPRHGDRHPARRLALVPGPGPGGHG
jgi:AcrR family transcriptional regulator